MGNEVLGEASFVSSLLRKGCSFWVCGNDVRGPPTWPGEAAASKMAARNSPGTEKAPEMLVRACLAAERNFEQSASNPRACKGATNGFRTHLGTTTVTKTVARMIEFHNTMERFP